VSRAVAILGSSYLLPSASKNEFGMDLLDGKNLIGSIAKDRWSLESFSHTQKSHPGTTYTFHSGSVGDVSQFDAAFFGISPREAAQMDPQQRVLLELSWQAFENAGIKPSAMRGAGCGVYIGIASADYSYRLAEDLASIDSSVATGNTASISANRISYFFDLRGPSMAIDTACSSSLVAFHQACQAIRSGEITHALTGGISLHLHPYGFIIFSKASMLSPNGNCNVFDEAGDGYVRSEGGGMFVLKDYDLALADGDRILAVVSHSAVNTDGKKSGLTIPKPEAQAELLISSYATAGISPDEISYIEAHGTGTAVGDPIETLALGKSLGQQRKSDEPLLIGSVKSNLGHLEAASGVAGLAKALFVIEHRKIPATIGIKKLNPRIDFKGLNLDVVTETRELPQNKPVIVGVNSFGFGGANAHVILRSHGAEQHSTPHTSYPAANHPTPFLISAATPLALQAVATRVSRALLDKEVLNESRDDFLYDAAYQLAFRREAFEHRAVLFGHTDKIEREYLSSQLVAYADGSDNSDVIVGSALNTGILVHGSETCARGPAFFYSGNGSQWIGMGRALLDDAVFTAAIHEIDQTFIGLAGFSIAAQLQGLLPELSYENTDVAQPALFAVQVGVTRMLAAMGVSPQAVAGHSVGEVAAAWAAGILDLQSAVEVIYHRSRLQQLTKGLGNMTAVAQDVDTAISWLSQEGLSDAVCIAGENSYRGITIAGTDQSLSSFETRLTKERVGFKRLDLDYAFHSPAMDGIETEIEGALGHLTPHSGSIPFYSAVTGGLLTGQALTADYWWKNIRQPVLFELAANDLLNDGFQVFAEIGPHPVLRGYLNDCLSQQSLQSHDFDHKCVVLPGLSRQNDGIEAVQEIVARTWIAGAKIDLSVFFPVVGQHVTLPPYPWQKERHWHSVSAESPNTLNRVIEHPLLGYRLPQHELLWENQIDPYRQSFLADHVVGDAVVFPGTGYIELALAAAQVWHPAGIKQLEDLEILSPITFNSGHGKVLRVGIDAADGRVKIQSRDLLSAEGWNLNARARIIVDARFPVVDTDPGLESESLEQLSMRIPDFNGASHLALTRLVGLQYGPAFKAIRHGWLGSAFGSSTSEKSSSGDSASRKEFVTALFDIPESIAESLDKFHIHPALLDCSFQLIIQMLRDRIDWNEGIAFLPTQIGRISLHPGMGVPHRVKVRLLRKLTHSLLAEFTLFNAEGHVIVRIEGARFRRVRLQKATVAHSAIQNIHTRYIPLPLQSGMHASRVRYQAVLDAGNDIARRSVIDRNYRNYVDELDPLLDALCSAFAFEALTKLGLTDNAQTSAHVIEDLVERSPKTAALLQHLIRLCIEDGKIIEDVEGIRLCSAHIDEPDNSTINEFDALSIWNTLITDYPDYFAVVHTVGKIGQHLSQFVSGELSHEQVVGKTSLVAMVTEELVSYAVKARLVRAMREVFKQAAQQRSPAERLGILEVAAFKPSIACEIGLLEISDNCDVVFACPDFAELETLNQLVESHPQLQLDSFAAEMMTGTGSEAGYKARKDYRVDLAIVWLQFGTAALNNKAIDYAIRHLKPGGTLLVEGLHRTRWLDFTFGWQESWWLDQADGKKISMQRDRATWESRLASMGLENVRHMDATHEATAGSFMLIAHMPLRAIAQASGHYSPRSWLLIDDDSDTNSVLRNDICTGLQQRGDIVSVMRLSDLHQELDFVSDQLIAMRADFGELDGIIHIKGLGARYHSTSGVNRCMSAATLVKACQETSTTASIWFITQGVHEDVVLHSSSRVKVHDASITADVMLCGFIRTLSNEINSNRVKSIDLSAQQLDQGIVYELIDELSHDSSETEVVLTPENGRFVPRLQVGHHVRAEQGITQSIQSSAPMSEENQTIQLNFSQPGQLRNLQWQTVEPRELADDEVEIEVEATGLNFRDVMYALGLLSDEAIENGFAGATIGLECAGKITRIGKQVIQFAVGERVVGFGPACFANRVFTKAAAISYIPRSLSSEAAATIPSTFLTSYYALVHLGRLQAGEKILIHGAAGGVGLAAIQIARWCGAEIFATAGSDEKRDLLRMMGVNHVLDSRSLSFAEDVMSITRGLGIDMVLNSLAGEAINRNLSILKPFGRFLELGKRDFYENTRIGLRPFRNNITYFGIDADQLMNERPELTAKLFGEVMDLFDKGILHALPFTRFEARDVVEAFRYMQQSQQIGKIVVTYRNGIPAVDVLSSNAVDLNEVNLKATDRLVLDKDASYVVTGGLGGFGLRTAQWLADIGARHLILLGRRGPDTDEARTGIQSLESMGVKVSAYACDVTDETALSATLSPWMPDIKGVIHAAAVIEDSLIENLSAEQLERVIRPKVTGALNLHRLTENQSLDFFVLFSSATTLFGNPGQAAYIAANAGLEAIAAMRRANGLPVTCMLWGAIGDAGFLARNLQVKEALQHRMGGQALSSAEALDQLEQAILHQYNNEGVLELDFTALSKFLPSAQSPRFSELARLSSHHDQDTQKIENIPSLLKELDQIALNVVFIDIVKNELSHILRIAPDKIDSSKSIYDMGLDSLMGVELVVALEVRFGVRLSVMAISENPSIEKLAQRLISLLRSQIYELRAQTSSSKIAQTHTEQVTELVKLHGSDSNDDEIASLASDLNTSLPHQAGKFLQ
jgi:phthiocerol/phenolphthiocerol synthesis type-I polyketide synthase C